LQNNFGAFLFLVPLTQSADRWSKVIPRWIANGGGSSDALQGWKENGVVSETKLGKLERFALDWVLLQALKRLSSTQR
jgi:hypothetical protein